MGIAPLTTPHHFTEALIQFCQSMTISLSTSLIMFAPIADITQIHLHPCLYLIADAFLCFVGN